MLFQNDYFQLFIEAKEVVILPIKTGYPLKSFDKITQEYPRLKINSFVTLRNALTQVGEKQVIGTWLPLVEATVSKDRLSIELVINASAQEIEESSEKLIKEANQVLDEKEVVYGRKNLQDIMIKPGASIIAAEGREAVKGADAVVTYIERPARKPVIREDGTANHYEMNFVFPIEENQWLGEKILPRLGENGIDIFGDVIPALPGDDVIIEYDRESVYEQEEEGKIVIYALHGGTLEYINRLIGVGKLLVVDGDVGPETGSISFDGAVRVKGTVHAGYSVVATEDISIEGNEGVTNAKIIQSTNGDIYIKGGVFGGNVTVIEAKGNIYLKHANNCKLYGSEIYAGLYLFGTDTSANYVYVDKNKGRIIGGAVEALFAIECAVAGNLHERETILRVQGINQKEVYKEVQEMAKELKERQDLVENLEKHSEKISKVATHISGEQKKAYEKTLDTIRMNEVEIINLDKEIQFNLQRMKAAKTPLVEVAKEAFPGTVIQIGKNSTVLNRSATGVFKVIDGVLNV